MCTEHALIHSRLVAAALALLLAGTLGVTAGCANWPPQTDSASSARRDAANCDGSLSAADKTRLSGVEQLLGDGKFYAALAQLDALGLDAPQARMIRADALRRIDRSQEAQALYQGLVGSCLDGRAQHGLGLIASKAGQHAAGLAYLQKARQALPTDTAIRNDLGYAYLLAGQFDAAEFEFLTVLDLNPQDAKASRNLVLLAFSQGKNDKAMTLARKLGLDEATTARLQAQAGQK